MKFRWTPIRCALVLAFGALFGSLLTRCAPEPEIAGMFTLEQLREFKNYDEINAKAFVNNVSMNCEGQNAGDPYSALKYCAEATAKGVYLAEKFGLDPHHLADRSLQLHRKVAQLTTDATTKKELLASARLLAKAY